MSHKTFHKYLSEILDYLNFIKICQETQNKAYKVSVICLGKWPLKRIKLNETDLRSREVEYEVNRRQHTERSKGS